MKVRHREIASLRLKGLSGAEIARRLGYRDKSWVNEVLRREDVNAHIGHMLDLLDEETVELMVYDLTAMAREGRRGRRKKDKRDASD